MEATLDAGGVDSVCDGLGTGLEVGKRESGIEARSESELSPEDVDDDCWCVDSRSTDDGTNFDRCEDDGRTRMLEEGTFSSGLSS